MISDLSRVSGKLGHVDGDLVEGLKESERMILGIMQL